MDFLQSTGDHACSVPRKPENPWAQPVGTAREVCARIGLVSDHLRDQKTKALPGGNDQEGKVDLSVPGLKTVALMHSVTLSPRMVWSSRC